MATPNKPVAPQDKQEEELGTDMPLSEKDEVKQAEANTAQSVHEHSSGAAADPKKSGEHPTPGTHQ